MTIRQRLRKNYLNSRVTHIKALRPEKETETYGFTVGVITDEIQGEKMVWVNFPDSNRSYCLGLAEFEIIDGKTKLPI